MSNPAPSNVARLTAYGVLELTGTDTAAFLHAQLSNDIANLPPDRSMLAAHCNAQGRVSSLLRVWHTQGGMRLLLPADQMEATAKRLRMFVLRSKVVIQPRDDLDALGLTDVVPDIAPEPAGTVSRQGGADWLWLPGNAPRAAVVGTQESLNALPLPAPGTDSTRYEQGEIDTGLAQVWAETREVFLPHHLNLDLTEGVSFRKGCYPGQEIVARMQYRGRPTRRMLRASGPCPPPPAGTGIWAVGHAQAQGQVVRSVATPQGCSLLAVVQVTAYRSALHLGQIDGPELQVQTSPYRIPEWDETVDNSTPTRAP